MVDTKFQCRFARQFPNTGSYCLAILSYGWSYLSPQSLKRIGELRDFIEYVELHVNMQPIARNVSTGPILGTPKSCILLSPLGPSWGGGGAWQAGQLPRSPTYDGR
jgi:hypothetical protein